MYEVVFDPKAVDFLKKLPKRIRARIYNKIISSKKKPSHFFKRLEKRTDYALRVGDYRVIADIDRNNKKIKVTLIGHRKKVYKKSK